MGVSTPVQSDHTAQTGTVYKTSLDDGFAVAKRDSWAFAPHEQATPDMTVRLDAGFIPKVAALATEIAAQNTGAITAPTTNPRKDIVHIDKATGAVGVATGTEAASPVDPAVPAGEIAVARINLVVNQTSIINIDLDDLRNLGFLGLGDLATADLAADPGLELTGDNLRAKITVGIKRIAAGLSLDIAGLTAVTAPATGDAVPIEDVSVPGRRKITLANLLKVINGLTEDTAPADGDFLLEYDVSAGTVKKVRKDKLGGGGAWTWLATVTAVNAATAEFTTGINSTYDQYVIVGTDINPATDNTNLWIRTDSNGGASFDAGASDYSWAVDGVRFESTMQVLDDIDAAATQIVANTDITNKGLDNGTSSGSNIIVYIHNPSGTTYHKMLTWQLGGVVYSDPTGVFIINGVGKRAATAAINAIQFLMSSGNLDGTFRLYGVANA